MTSGIYVVTNMFTFEQYIGSSINIEHRWTKHRDDLRHGKHINDRLQAAWNEWHEPAFDFQVLELVEDTTRLRKREREHIERLTPAYNLAIIRSIPARQITITVSPAGWKLLDQIKSRCNATQYIDKALRSDPFIEAVLSGADPDDEAYTAYCEDAWNKYRRRNRRWQQDTYRCMTNASLSIDVLRALDKIAPISRGHYIEDVLWKLNVPESEASDD